MTRRQRLRRWLFRLLVAAVAARMLLAITLPWILAAVGHGFGLSIRYDSASLSLHRLSLRLSGLEVRDPDHAAAPPLFSAHELAVDVSLTRLLAGEVELTDAVVAGGRVHLQRAPDGVLRLPAAMVAPAAAAAPAPAEPEASSTFRAPVRMRSVRLHDFHLVLEQLGPSPSVTEASCDLVATGIGCGEGPGAVALRAHGPALFDDLWLDVAVEDGDDHLQIGWRGALRGLRPATLPAALSSLPIWTSVHALGLDLHGELHGRRDGPTGDRAVYRGSCTVAASADDRTLLTFTVTAPETERANSTTTQAFAIVVRGDQFVEDLRLEPAALAWSGPRTEFAGTLVCRGLGLRFFAPWFAELGVALPPEGIAAAAELRAQVDSARGPHSVSAQVEGLSVAHGEERAAIRRLSIDGFCFADGRTTVEAIEVDSPEAHIAVQPDGRSTCAGVQWWTPAAAGAVPVAATSTTTAPPAWPPVSLGRLDVHGIAVGYRDHGAAGAQISLGNGVLRGEQLALGHEHDPGRMTFACDLPGIAGAVRAELRTRPNATGLAVDGDVAADAVTLAALQPWLARAGAEPELDAATARATLAMRLATTPQGLAVDASIENVRVAEAENTLLSIRRVEGNGMLAAGGFVQLGAWTIEDPFLLVHEDARGVAALGVRLAATPPPDPMAKAGTDAPPTAKALVPAAPSPPTHIAHGPIRLRGLAVRWCNERTGPEGAVASLDAEVGADPGDGGDVECEARLHLAGAIDGLRVHGTFRRAAAEFRCALELAANGIHGTGFAAFLPPHVRCTLGNGMLAGRLAVTATTGPESAWSLRAADWQLHDDGRELAAVDRAEIDVAAGAERIHVRTVRAGGLRAEITATPDGFALPAVTLDDAPMQPSPARPAGAETAATPPVPLLPALRIDEFEVAIDRITFQDRTAGEGRPLFASARMRLAAPWATAAEPADSDPLQLVATAALDPLCKEVQLHAAFAPYRIRPGAEITVRAAGIDTTALGAVLPATVARLRGTAPDAEFGCRVEASLDLRRRDVRRFDLRGPFGGEVLVTDVHFAAPGGEPWLAAEAVAVSARKFVPATGELVLRSIDVEGPRLRAVRTADGIDAMGLLLLPAPPVDAPSPAPPPPPSPRSAIPRFSLERLHVSGLEAEIVDATTTPTTRTPLHDGELLLQNLSLDPEARTPVTFELSASGGEVELERRVQRSSVLAGVLGSAADVLAGADDVHARERRPWLDEFRATGRLVLGSRPAGEVLASVRALELPALRSPAKAAGVDLADGSLDLDARLQIRDAGVRLESRSVFTWLSLAEPAGGPISTYLRLPLPLDTVLFLLRNDADEHVIPMAVDVPSQGVTGGAILAAAGEALAHVLAEAVSKSAFRLTGAVGGALGLDSERAPLPATPFEFAPGESTTRASIEALVEALRDDARLGVVLVHEPGPADLARADELANPPPDVVAATAASLRAQRAALQAERDLLAGQTAAAWATARLHDARALQARLADADARLGGIEAALDEALTMQFESDARTHAARARTALLALAVRRLDTLRLQLTTALGEGAADRIQVRRPRAGVSRGPGRVVANLRVHSLR